MINDTCISFTQQNIIDVGDYVVIPFLVSLGHAVFWWTFIVFWLGFALAYAIRKNNEGNN